MAGGDRGTGDARSRPLVSSAGGAARRRRKRRPDGGGTDRAGELEYAAKSFGRGGGGVGQKTSSVEVFVSQSLAAFRDLRGSGSSISATMPKNVSNLTG